MKTVNQSVEAESGEGESEMERLKQVRIKNINVDNKQKPRLDIIMIFSLYKGPCFHV